MRELVRALGVLDDARTPCGAELSVREAYALGALLRAEERGAALTQSELQRVLGVDKSNTTRLVQQLVAEERVEQRSSEHDARARTLYLTAKGKRAALNVEQRSLARFAAVLTRIPAREREGVLRGLDVLCRALRAEEES